MVWQRYIAAIGLSLSLTAQADLVQYVVAGDLAIFNSPDPSAGDVFNLHGSSFTFTVIADTEAVASRITISTEVSQASWFAPNDVWTSQKLAITNRPNGSSDFNAEVDSNVWYFHIQNIDVIQPNLRDGITIGDFLGTGELAGLHSGDFRFFFKENFFPTLADLDLPSSIAIDDLLLPSSGIDVVNWPLWIATYGEAREIYYQPSNLTLTAQIVPVAPALWLLSSAIFFLGVMRQSSFQRLKS